MMTDLTSFALRRALAMAAAAAAMAVGVATPAAAAGGSYAAVNELRMYYEIQGKGRPLVLLHGGICTIEVCMGKLRTAFGTARRTITIEQQGHGRTADVDRPLSFDQMAEDTAALLSKLNIQHADFLGYSDGGNVAMRIAMRHPQLVRKIVVLGTNFDNEGLVPGVVEAFKTMTAQDMPTEFRQAYAKVAPDASRWPVLVSKVLRQGVDFKGWSEQELKSVAAPVMFMMGDADIVLPEHALKVTRLLPHAKLAVLPATDHFAPVTRAAWVAAMSGDFLDAPMPVAK